MGRCGDKDRKVDIIIGDCFFQSRGQFSCDEAEGARFGARKREQHRLDERGPSFSQKTLGYVMCDSIDRFDDGNPSEEFFRPVQERFEKEAPSEKPENEDENNHQNHNNEAA